MLSKQKLFFLLIFLLSVAQVQAIEYGGVGGRPANPRADNPRSESIFIYTGEPGAVFLDGIKVINNSKERKSLRVYATDEEMSSGGAFSCEQYSQSKDGVGSWIDLQSEVATLSAVSSQTVPFVVTIPTTASVGEHNGCIVIQPEDPPISNEAGGIQLRMRTALRVLITVPGEIRRKLQIVATALEHRPEQGDIMVRAEIQNTGNASADTTVSLRVTSFLPLTIFTSEGDYPILRDSTYALNLQAPYPFWGGWYRVNVSARYAPTATEAVGVELATSEYETVESVSRWYWFMPDPRALGIYAVVLGLLLFLIAMVVMSLLQQNNIRKTWQPYRVRPGDTLPDIAKARHVSWRLLAKVNKIKAPYVVQAGQEIKVPPRANHA